MCAGHLFCFVFIFHLLLYVSWPYARRRRNRLKRSLENRSPPGRLSVAASPAPVRGPTSVLLTPRNAAFRAPEPRRRRYFYYFKPFGGCGGGDRVNPSTGPGGPAETIDRRETCAAAFSKKPRLSKSLAGPALPLRRPREISSRLHKGNPKRR